MRLMTELTLPPAYILHVDGQLDSCLSQLSRVNAIPIRGEQFAVARIYYGPQSAICRKGSWLVGYDLIKVPNGDLLMTLPEHSIILENPSMAIATHRAGDRIYLTKKQSDALLERANTDLFKALESGVLRVPKGRISPKVPTYRYGEVVETLFVYGAEASAYGDFLNCQKIDTSTHNIANAGPKGAVANGLWVHGIRDSSLLRAIMNGRLCGGPKDDITSGRVFGVQNVSTGSGTHETPQERSDLEKYCE